MSTKIRRIGVLTSGGDAPGMNACVRAVTRTAIDNGIEVVAIYEGYKGLIEGNLRVFGMRDVSNIINQGGTKIYTARSALFKTDEGLEIAAKRCRDNNIDGIVAIGGDGTFRGATDLTRKGIPCVCVPATIDNDITATDYTIGYDTAMNTAIEMVDRLRDTCESHFRCNVVEVMGRHAGYIALNVGLATGASQVVCKELPVDEERMYDEITTGKRRSKRNYIIMVAEGVEGYAEAITTKIQERTGIETRFTRLGHVVRGGSPTVRDRVIASQMGAEAVKLLMEGKENLVVCYKNEKLMAMDIEYALALDNLYKGKKSATDLLTIFDAETVLKMQSYCDEKKKEFAELYELVMDISR